MTLVAIMIAFIVSISPVAEPIAPANGLNIEINDPPRSMILIIAVPSPSKIGPIVAPTAPNTSPRPLKTPVKKVVTGSNPPIKLPIAAPIGPPRAKPITVPTTGPAAAPNASQISFPLRSAPKTSKAAITAVMTPPNFPKPRAPLMNNPGRFLIAPPIALNGVRSPRKTTPNLSLPILSRENAARIFCAICAKADLIGAIMFGALSLSARTNPPLRA